MKNVLMVAAHPDDVELGAAGLALLLKRSGWVLHYVVLAGVGYPKAEELMSELARSCELMGVKDQLVCDFPNTQLPDHSHEIRNVLVRLEENIRPGLVLIPSVNDTHQDHVAVASESVRTFRHRETILSYEIHRHGSYVFKPNVFVDIESVLEEKLEVLASYKTQLHRAYFNEDVFRSIARVRGTQVGIEYAEAFEAVKVFYDVSVSAS